jgi:hypothetical protein
VTTADTCRRLTEAAAAVGMEIDFKETGHADYMRGFLKLADGLVLARLVIHKGLYSHANWYVNPSRDIDKYDYHQWRWAAAWHHDTVITAEQWEGFCIKAVALANEDFAKKKAWRTANPKPDGTRRARLEGRSPNAFLREIVAEYLGGLDGQVEPRRFTPESTDYPAPC